MLGSWTRLSRGQKRTWKVIAGGIGSALFLQGLHFTFARDLMTNDSIRRHQQGMERLREAKEFSEWSKKDRESRLPQLTKEQREQMRQYLKIVDKHGLELATQKHETKKNLGLLPQEK